MYISGCEGNPADIYFLLDSSNSVYIGDFRTQLAFIQSMIDEFPMSPEETRIGVGLFGHRYKNVIGFTSYRTTDNLKASVGSIRKISGLKTETGEALKETRRYLSRNSRRNVTRIVIVITDGRSHNKAQTISEAQKLKDEGVSVFAIGVGSKTVMSELEELASSPSSDYVYTVAKYGLLPIIRTKLAMKTCIG